MDTSDSGNERTKEGDGTPQIPRFLNPLIPHLTSEIKEFRIQNKESRTEYPFFDS
jgi:hypothetical protein